MRQQNRHIDDGGRVPPQAPEVEEGVLGACLLEKETLEITIGELGHNTDIFYKPPNRTIYEAMLNLHGKGTNIDLLTLENYLRDENKLAPVGGSGYLAELTRSVSSAANVEHHCQILLEKWTKRQIILNNTDQINMAYDSSSDPYDVLDKAMKDVDQISDRLYTGKGDFASDLLEGVLSDIEWRRENPGINGVPSGMPIDKYTGGWQPGNFYIIAARPSIGKTAFGGNAAFNAALFRNERFKTNVFYWNGEMKNEDLLKRRIALEARVNFIKMRDGNLSDLEMKRIVEAAGHVYNGTVKMDDTPGININEFRAKYKTACRRHDIGLGIVDYLQLMSGTTEGTREQEISSISRGLKAAAMETNTPIIALSQLSRECLKREGKEPFLADLRESGSLEQDADGVIMLNRPEFFGIGEFKGRPTKGKGIVKIEKMRNGMTGEFWMNFVKKFADWTPENMGRKTKYPQRPKPNIPIELFEDDEQFQDEYPF